MYPVYEAAFYNMSLESNILQLWWQKHKRILIQKWYYSKQRHRVILIYRKQDCCLENDRPVEAAHCIKVTILIVGEICHVTDVAQKNLISSFSYSVIIISYKMLKHLKRSLSHLKQNMFVRVFHTRLIRVFCLLRKVRIYKEIRYFSVCKLIKKILSPFKIFDIPTQ